MFSSDARWLPMGADGVGALEAEMTRVAGNTIINIIIIIIKIIKAFIKIIIIIIKIIKNFIKIIIIIIKIIKPSKLSSLSKTQ